MRLVTRRVESSVWLAFLFVSIWLGSAQAQPAAVNQKIDAKVMADLRQNARTTLYVLLNDRLCENWDVSKINTWLVESRGNKIVFTLFGDGVSD